MCCPALRAWRSPSRSTIGLSRQEEVEILSVQLREAWCPGAGTRGLEGPPGRPRSRSRGLLHFGRTGANQGVAASQHGPTVRRALPVHQGFDEGTHAANLNTQTGCQLYAAKAKRAARPSSRVKPGWAGGNADIEFTGQGHARRELGSGQGAQGPTWGMDEWMAVLGRARAVS